MKERIVAWVMYEDRGLAMGQQVEEPEGGWEHEDAARKAAQKECEKFPASAKAKPRVELIDPRPEAKWE